MPQEDDSLILNIKLAGDTPDGSPAAPDGATTPGRSTTADKIDGILSAETIRNLGPMAGSVLRGGSLGPSGVVGGGGLGTSSLIAAGAAGVGLAGIALGAGALVSAGTRTFDAGIQGITRFAVGGERSDPVSMAAGALRGVSQIADPLQALTGINLNPVDDIFRTLVTSVEQVILGLDRMAVSLSGVSGPVARETALQEARMLRARISRGQILGEDLASFVAARGDMALQIEEIRTALVKDLIPLATAAVRALSSGIETADEAREWISNSGAVSWLGKFFTNNPDIRVAATARIIRAIFNSIKAFEDKERDKGREDLLSEEIKRFLDPESLMDPSLPVPPAGFPPIGPGMGGP